jgi:Fe-S cluster assembly iron-binding protein IscA
LGLALDEPQKDDEVFEEGGITYVINKQLFDRVKPIQVDFVETVLGSGYRISSNLKRTDDSCC